MARLDILKAIHERQISKLREMDELDCQLVQVSGYSIRTLIDLFREGYALLPPTNSSVSDIYNVPINERIIVGFNCGGAADDTAIAAKVSEEQAYVTNEFTKDEARKLYLLLTQDPKDPVVRIKYI